MNSSMSMADPVLGTGDTDVNQKQFLPLRSSFVWERHSDNVTVIKAGMVRSQAIVRAQRYLNEPGGQGRLLGEADS